MFTKPNKFLKQTFPVFFVINAPSNYNASVVAVSSKVVRRMQSYDRELHRQRCKILQHKIQPSVFSRNFFYFEKS
jgi:hypothetical protein